MAIALHPFLIGVPHRIGYLDRALRHIASHGKVWFATGSEDHRGLSGAGEGTMMRLPPWEGAVIAL